MVTATILIYINASGIVMTVGEIYGGSVLAYTLRLQQNTEK